MSVGDGVSVGEASDVGGIEALSDGADVSITVVGRAAEAGGRLLDGPPRPGRMMKTNAANRTTAPARARDTARQGAARADVTIGRAAGPVGGAMVARRAMMRRSETCRREARAR